MITNRLRGGARFLYGDGLNVRGLDPRARPQHGRVGPSSRRAASGRDLLIGADGGRTTDVVAISTS